MKENYFKQDAKQIVDMLFDNNVFRKNVTREDMNATEEFINFLMESKFEIHLKLENLINKIDKP